MEICLQFHKHAQENNKINSPFAIRRRYYVVSLTLFGIWAQFTCSSKCMKINKTSRRQNVPESSGKVLNPEKTMFPLYSRQTNLQKASRIVKGKHSASFDSFQPLLMWLKLSVSLARVRAHSILRVPLELPALTVGNAPVFTTWKNGGGKKRYRRVSTLWWRVETL